MQQKIVARVLLGIIAAIASAGAQAPAPVRSRPHPWELSHADVFGRVGDPRKALEQEASCI